MCTGKKAGCGGGSSSGTPNYTTKFKKPTAMVSKNSVGFQFGPYGAKKASEVIGRTKMPAMPKSKRQF